MKDDIPDSLGEFIIIVLGVIAWLWMGYGFYSAFSPKPTPEGRIERIESDLMVVQGNSLKASVSPNNDYSGTRIVRVITAYNPVKSQTDSTPCISASGLNVCETNKKIFASNEFRFGQKIVIDGVIWECQDRTNSRYNYRIDLLMYDYDEAKNWGVRTREIILLN